VSAVTYGRFADGAPPERELLAVDDEGVATGWRSMGPIGGRVGGAVPDRAGLDAAIAAASDAPDPGPARLVPDAVREELEAGGHKVTLPLDDPPAGPWADLAAACRAALDAVTAQPVAAIEAAMDKDGGLRLAHRGAEPLTVELGSIRAKATLWRDGAEAWSADYALPPGLERTAVSEGWSLDLDPAEPVPPGGGTLVARVDLVADDEGVFVPLTLTGNVQR
jgi:hypothetical protein